MARKIVVVREGGESPVLEEVAAHDEAQLQERMKHHPDLLPIDEFDLAGPLMVIGRETRLPSGAVDLLGVTPAGDVVIIEFKTGPQNPDFRSALSQLVDYGSDLWRMSYEQFEAKVVVPYLTGPRCAEGPTKAKASLLEAAAAQWEATWQEDDAAGFIDRLTAALAVGEFHFVVVAQRFTDAMERTAEYLNMQSSSAAFYLVELVRFEGDSLSAFEARTVLKPTPGSSGAASKPMLTRQAFLERIEDETFAATLEDLFTWCEARGLALNWGTSGMSIRMKVPDRSEPVSIGWAFPTGTVGWYGLSDLNLGVDDNTVKVVPSVAEPLGAYALSALDIAGAEPLHKGSLKGVRVDAALAASVVDEVKSLIASLQAAIEGGGTA
ncbi:MAG: hypothetical protein JNK12_12470 [Acidimicrobiales bacterium]|nr:hypothetical protein [Acidimicrobiales bacterium]